MNYEAEYLEYLNNVRRMSENSLMAYIRDLRDLNKFMAGRGIEDLKETSSTDIIAYVQDMKMAGRASSTVSRKVASARAFFDFLIKQGYLRLNPADDIKNPRSKSTQVDFLSVEEMTRILDLPGETIKGIRDKAILETLYATGIKATELIEADLEDVNLHMGFMTCGAKTAKARIVPIGTHARYALAAYLNVRESYVDEDEKALFVNYNGGRISRQGLWKILSKYGELAGLEKNLTPNIIRNSFAVHMLQNGASLKAIQDLMGYEDISAVQIYLSAIRTRIKDVYDNAHPRA